MSENFNPLQLAIFVGLTAFIAFMTWVHCRGHGRQAHNTSTSDYFLAGKSLSWVFIAGSITLTNLSTDQLVGMNGQQMFLLATWELAAVVGLFILAFIFIPIYFRNNCTTTTELLRKKYNNKHISSLIAFLFLAGNIGIFLPLMLYGGARFMITMFNLPPEVGGISTIYVIAIALAIIGGAYAILGGLRAVAVSDTYSGVGLLVMSVILVWLALKAIDFDFSGIPSERLSMVGGNDSPIPWHTLLTGMILIQTFYWSTNQTITQRAMAAGTISEAQKGVVMAAAIRLLIVPIIVVVPGVIAFKLYGAIPNDGAFGTIVGRVLPPYLSGAFAAVMMAAVLTSYNSVLNSSAALYVVDLHENYIGKARNVPRLSAVVSLVFILLGLTLVGYYASAPDGIIETVQRQFGLLSMPILQAFVVCLLFRNVSAYAAMIGTVFGVCLYAVFTLPDLPEALRWTPGNLHYIHYMFITFWSAIAVSLVSNLVIFQKVAKPAWGGEKVANVS